ncbi:rho-type GTPase activating protein Rga6 [Schizosaccharomyces cryophilus OY26]|uniref:Rho-type GTPase activating protein Rga6 n=1 Tax=Schizosaccharomyces cryophilus (strain OY26 / ATCC MYA-4695 / CBS 11777 / NBRC 106824 / NRRL Y48691) TaxID=653667 RepID=S9VRH5_SCHCR|nr:rho-type GTPase activating protein Rga6 [Schizosaccharomyces cryophilus OY26]EPY50543.1 rho-type GTPase activating protein Rga6 [Schizosaccharomyces cryophilus OY26]
MLFRSSTVKHGSGPSANLHGETETNENPLETITETNSSTSNVPKPSVREEQTMPWASTSLLQKEQEQEKYNELRKEHLRRYQNLFNTYNLPKKNLEEVANQSKGNRFSYYIQDDTFDKLNSFDETLHQSHDDGYVTPSGSPTKLKSTPKNLPFVPEMSLDKEQAGVYVQEPAVLEKHFDESFHTPSRRPVSSILPSQDLFFSTPQQSPSKNANNSEDFSPNSRTSMNLFSSPTQDSPKRSPSKHSLGRASLSSLLRRPSSSYSPKKQSPGIHRRSLTNYFKFSHRGTVQQPPPLDTVFGKSVEDLSNNYAEDLCKFFFQTNELAPFPLLLPHVFAQCIYTLSINALHVPGIFRISGSGPIIKAIMRHYSSPPHYWLDETSSIFQRIGFPTSIDIGGVLKRFIMLLPGGLLGTKDVLNMLVPLFLDESSSLPSDVWAELIAFAIAQIDSIVRFSLLCSLMALLRQVSLRTQELEATMENVKDSSLMKSEALGIIFGPLLLGNSITDLSKSNRSSDFNNLMHFETEKARLEARIVEGLINHWPEIMSKLTSFNIHQSFPDCVLLNLVPNFQPAIPLIEEPVDSTAANQEHTAEKSITATSAESQIPSEVTSLPSVAVDSKSNPNDSGSQFSTTVPLASASTPHVAHIQEENLPEQEKIPSQSGVSNVQIEPVYSRSEPLNLSSQAAESHIPDSKDIRPRELNSAVRHQPETHNKQQSSNLKKSSRKKSSKGNFLTRFFGKFKSVKKKH